MIYSVYNYATKRFAYYEVPVAPSTHAGKPPSSRWRLPIKAELGSGQRLGSTADDSGWILPPGARKVGDGAQPRGRIAQGPQGALGAVTDPLPLMGLGAAALVTLLFVLKR